MKVEGHDTMQARLSYLTVVKVSELITLKIAGKCSHLGLWKI